MKTYLYPILKALGLTAALDLTLVLFLVAAAPMANLNIGQVFLFRGVALLSVAATCLYAGITVEKRRSLWLSLVAALPTHLILSVASVLVYADRLASNWPGSDYYLTWLLFLLLCLAIWSISITAITIARSARIGSRAKEEKKRIRRETRGFRLVVSPQSPAKARTIAALKGSLWVLWLYVATGLLLEWYTQVRIADTILSYITFPCLWCIMATVCRFLRTHNCSTVTISAAITNLVVFAAVMLFLIPANVKVHAGYALLYLDNVLTDPFSHPEQLLVLMQFLLVWVILIITGATQRKTKDTSPSETESIPHMTTV
jgi:hypothetical protein